MSKGIVFLTGGSGFLGSHVAAKVLEAGFGLKASFRTEKKAQAFRNAFAGYKVQTCIVPDIGARGAYAGLLNDTSYVIHCASPYTFKVDDIQRDLIEPAVKGTTEIFREVEFAPNIKRVVVTSSFAAVINPFEGPRPGYMYTEDDWNPITPEKAADNKILGYQASKKFAEISAWDFFKSSLATGNHASVVTICPPMIYGPAHEAAGITMCNLNESSAQLLAAIQDETLVSTRMPVFVDVRDVATAHVKALNMEILPTSERFLVCGGKYTWAAVRDIARGGKATPESLGAADGYYSIDATKAEKMLGMKWTPLDSCIIDFMASLGLKVGSSTA